MKRRRKRVILLLAFAAATVAVTAATNVNTFRGALSAEKRQALRSFRGWSRTVALDMPSSNRRAWRAIAEKHPAWILQACARPTENHGPPHVAR